MALLFSQAQFRAAIQCTDADRNGLANISKLSSILTQFSETPRSGWSKIAWITIHTIRRSSVMVIIIFKES